MNSTTIMEGRLLSDYQKNFRLNLFLEKKLVEEYFDWIKLEIRDDGMIVGKGALYVNNVKYEVNIGYSPFFPNRFDRIHIKGIEYNPGIHVYGDLSLCLYHPKIDTSPFRITPLIKMIPWISEWCVHYEEWKKYGVWLGKEIKH